MKLWLVGAFIIYFSLPVALGLKCYECKSKKSWDDCKTTSVECSAGDDQCAKVHSKVEGIGEWFERYCASDAACDKNKPQDNPTCKGNIGKNSECKIDCCTGDDCNAGSAFRISGILLLTCALVSLMNKV